LLKLAPDTCNPFGALDSGMFTGAFSRRAFGNMSLSYGDTNGAVNNRRNFLNSLGIDYKDLVCAKQAHGNNVMYAKDEHKGRGALAYETSIPDTDGFITDFKNLPLAIFTADCLSVFLYDPARPAIGLVHSGWRGLRENIVLNAVELMRSNFNTKPSELFAGFGPCIKGCCYEVSAEFKDYFPGELVERRGRLFLDLGEANKKRLTALGVKDENIFSSCPCTFCDNENLFSFRREGKACARTLSVIMLK